MDYIVSLVTVVRLFVDLLCASCVQKILRPQVSLGDTRSSSISLSFSP